MSYYAKICFKTIDSKALPEFFVSLKTKATASLDQIAEENCVFSPYARLPKATKESIVHELMNYWARASIFSFRWFYLKDEKLLGMFCIPDALDECFDLVQFFQNSCDQDYPFDDWDGIPCFERIARKWQALDSEAVTALTVNAEDPVSDIEYFKRAQCYAEIFGLFSDYFWHEEKTTIISLFGQFDCLELSRFRVSCEKHYKEEFE